MLSAEIHDLLGPFQDPESFPPASYWTDLATRTNRQIDDATSGRALSISWAARVAIPGVVAIICFFIGLHYYVPELPSEGASLTEMVDALPVEARELLVAQLLSTGGIDDIPMVSEEPIPLATMDIVEYLVENNGTQALLETMSEERVDGFLGLLRNHQLAKPQ